MSLLTGCDFPQSGRERLSVSRVSLWRSAASFLTLQTCLVRRQYEVVRFWFCLDLWLLFAHCCSVSDASPIKEGLRQCGESCKGRHVQES